MQAEKALLGLHSQLPCLSENEHGGQNESEATAAKKGRSGGSGDVRQLEHAAVQGREEARHASKVRSGCAAHARSMCLVLAFEDVRVISPSWCHKGQVRECLQ